MKSTRLIFSLLTIITLSLAACAKEKPKPAEPPATPITAAAVKLADVPDSAVAVGTVVSKNEAVLSSNIMGVIRQFWVDEGDTVGKGKILLTIEDDDIKAQRRGAVEARAEGVASFAEAEAAIEEARAAVENAGTNLSRFEALYKENAVTKKELDDIATQKRMADAKLAQAQAAKKRVNAKIAQADAAIEQAEVMLGYTIIRSPIAGVVTQKSANAGEVATPGRPLVKVVDDDSLQLLTSVKESDVSGMFTGREVKVTVDALPEQIFMGRVAEIIPAADPATRAFSVKINLPPAPGLLPGMFGRAHIPSGTRKAALMPDDALVEYEGVAGVYVITPMKTLRFQPVRTGETFEGGVEAVTGLSGGETVAVGNTTSLKDGMRVVVK